MTRLGAAILVAGLGLAVAAPGAEAGKAPPCNSAGITEAKNDSVRVYEVSDGDGNHEVKACRIRTRERTTLYSYFSCDCSTGDENPPDRVVLSGLYAIVVWTPASGPPGASPGPPPASALDLFDIGRRKQVRSLSAGPDEIVLRRQGSFAYREGAELYAVPRKGKPTVIDKGPVKSGSLKLDGRRLTWVSAGQRRETTLD